MPYLWFEHNPDLEYVALDNFYAQGMGYYEWCEIASWGNEEYFWRDERGYPHCEDIDPSMLYSALIDAGWDFEFLTDEEAAEMFGPRAEKVYVTYIPPENRA